MARHVTQWLAEYHDHELPAWRQDNVGAHLAACPSCRSELERLERLSKALSVCELGDRWMNAETWRAQVLLRVSRRTRSRARYGHWAWYVIPLSLGSLLLFMQAAITVLIVPFGILKWGGVGVMRSVVQSWQTWIPPRTVWGTLVASYGLGLLDIVVWICLSLALVFIFAPYAAWVGMLWYAVRKMRRST
jgi:hypothetical protein